MIKKTELIAYRGPTPEDKNFIYATWLRGIYYGNSWFHEIEKDAYFDFYHQVIEALFKKPQICVKVACLKSDPKTILGYSVYENGIVHFVYCKPVWRKIGLTSELIPEDTQWATHLTDLGKIVIKKKYPNIKFNPFLI